VVEGSADRTSAFPALTLSELRIGENARRDLRTGSSGSSAVPVALLLSGDGGFLSPGGFEGPPLAVQLADPFQILFGRTGADGTLVRSATLPADPLLLSFLLHAQAVVLEPGGPRVLSDAVVRSVGGF
jgi:hypothetical protein